MSYLSYIMPRIRHAVSGCFLVFVLAVTLAQPGLAGSVYDYTLPSIDGGELDLASFKGKPLLVVNTASQCGFTPQYDGLEERYQKFKDQDFEVLGFPCNQFGAQEPGSADEIAEFCKVNFGVTFPLMAKVDVNGADASPLFDWMKQEAPGALGTKAIKWNFTKFLINREGEVVKRYGSTDAPARIAKDVAKLL